ncbi:thiol:disulfide interchange protein DsbA precursor [archaeon BMS3Abin16]|nr:thiol:disulfide interchange protein DsbA precursor [archaeon BMS3Abin16]
MAKKRWKKKERLERVEHHVPEKGGLNSKLILAGVVILVLAGYFIFSGGRDTSIETPPPAVIAGKYTLFSDKPSTHVAGKVTLVEFFDFTCPHCYTFHKDTWPALKNKYGDKIELIDIGIPLRDSSTPPLEAYEIAKDFGKGDEMKDALFTGFNEEGKDITNVQILAGIAENIGLDRAVFSDLLSSGSKASVVESNIRLATSYKLTGTPTVIVDGNMKSTDNSLANLQTMIDSILALDTG